MDLTKIAEMINKISEADEKIKLLYPLVNFNGEQLKYIPGQLELEKGDLAEYLDVSDLEIKSGIIEEVKHTIPMNYPIYFIFGETHMYHRVWPKVDKDGNVISFKEKIYQNEKEFISKLNEMNKANLSAKK